MKRRGLRIRGHRGNPTVRRALVRFARWLRRHYEFPIRVPVYLYPSEWITTMHGSRASASFFGPFDRTVEPYIRIPTGDYPALRAKRGRDNALMAFLCSLAHELMHYWQWIRRRRPVERGVPRKAVALVRAYERMVRRP